MTIVYNNDTDNSARLGAGTDSEYAETSSGKEISFSPVKARYVRFYSGGNSVNGYNHYVEAEVYGSTSTNLAAGKSVTSSAAFTNIGRITDGSYDTNSYSDSTPNTGLQWIQFDLGGNVGNNLSKIVESLGVQSSQILTSYDYDKDNRLTKVTINNGSYISYLYDSIGRLNSSTINIGGSIQGKLYLP